MGPIEQHIEQPDASFDGGNLDCGNGLLLLIRQHMDTLEPGQILEIRSVEQSVEEELPAWCRLTSNPLVSWTKAGLQFSFLVRKKSPAKSVTVAPSDKTKTSRIPADRSSPTRASEAALTIPALAVMGIGSWPRPDWMLRIMHQYLEGKLSEDEYQQGANEAVRLVVAEQEKAGVDVITDGEQRRDNYSSFVGKRLENCQLIPLVDLLPMVDHPEEFQKQFEALDVPAALIRHPAVFGKIRRRLPLTVHEYQFLRTITNKPVKISLPGPYLLTRTMYLDCFKERAYEKREELAKDIVRTLREEIKDLLDAGVGMIQLDEPILTEIVFGTSNGQRSFMCGALSERGNSKEELQFAVELINATTAGFPQERIGMHVCRGNWSADEHVALRGSYEALLPAFNSINVGTLFLEFCTPRAGELSILGELRKDLKIGLGVVNPKAKEIESVESIIERIQTAAQFIALDRIILNPDCGFATFADAPITTSDIATRKLIAISAAARQLK